MLERRDQTSGIQLEEGGGFLVRVDFDVLVVEAFELEGDPDALDEGAA